MMSKEFMFRKSLVEDEPTDNGQKFLNELYSYIREELNGLKSLSFWCYRMDEGECFAVDMLGVNRKNCSLNIAITKTSKWDSMLHTIGINVMDGTDVMGIVQYLVGTFNLSNVREDRDRGVLVYSADEIF